MENYLFTIIIVNELYEIIDGQHRFDVIKELKLPLHYVICKGYGLNQVHILNQTSKTWIPDDYLDGYCMLGLPNYLKYQEFKTRYGFKHMECMAILGGNVSQNGALNGKAFYKGEFKIANYDKACEIGDNLELIAPYYPSYRRRSFVYAMLGLFKNKNFDFTEFLHKLKLQPTAMVDCTNITQYVSLIEEIYNYRRREKINLRY